MFIKQSRNEETKGVKHAVGYVRVSTDKQSDEDKFGIPAQKEAILKYAEENGYSVDRWFIDRMSGAKDNRPELNNILYGGACCNPPFEAVIVAKSDRLSRDTKLYFYYLYTLEKMNIKLLSASEQFEDDALANIYRSLLLFVAEMERKNIVQRTIKGKVEKAKNGGFVGGQVPFGYVSLGKGQLVINEDEARAVRMIYRLKTSGLSFSEVSRALENANICNRKGTVIWSLGQLQSILRNKRFYEGYIRYAGQPYIKGKHEPILEEGMYHTSYDDKDYRHTRKVEV